MTLSEQRQARGGQGGGLRACVTLACSPSRPHRSQFLGLQESSAAEGDHECECKRSAAAP